MMLKPLLLMAMAAAPVGAEESPTLILSHRGSTKTWPANTSEALEDALSEGFPGFEIDIRFTRDQVPVLSHDDKLYAATNCHGRTSLIRESEIRRCVVMMSPIVPEHRTGGKRAKRPTRIYNLAEVIERFLARPELKALVLDLKTPLEPYHLTKLREAIPTDRAMERKLVFITQHETDAKALNQEFPQANIALESNETVSGLIDSFARGADFWKAELKYDTLSLSFGSIDNPVLRLVKLIKLENQAPGRRFDRLYRCNQTAPPQLRKKLLVWTVNNTNGIRRVALYRPEYVLTDLRYHDFASRLRKTGPLATQHRPTSCPASVSGPIEN